MANYWNIIIFTVYIQKHILINQINPKNDFFTVYQCVKRTYPFLTRKRIMNKHFKCNKYEKGCVIGNGGFLCCC